MVLPTEALARLVCGEWNVQGDFIDLESMPATRLARVAIDSLPTARREFASRLAEYAADDLLCYFAEGPPRLVQRQKTAWEPVLTWAEESLGLTFHRATGIAHVDQPTDTLTGVEAAALAFSDFQLAGLSASARIFGSAILALALLKGWLTGSEAYAASQIDEAFQAESWGEDAEAMRRSDAMACEAEMLDRWFQALR